MNSIPSARLSRYLSQPLSAGSPGPSGYLSAGLAHLEAGDLAGLEELLPQVLVKANGLTGAAHLRRRVQVLAQFFEETRGQDTPVRREIAFSLFYFLTGYDLIPDSVPEVGLLDDALLIDTVFSRNEHDLRSHWTARKRTWPET